MTKGTYRPQRTCLGCGARDDQGKLIRLAVTSQDQLTVEPRRGRGGYLHRDRQCQKAFVSRKGQYRAFHVEVSRAAKAKLIEDLASRNWE
ncbi:MAG: YlxR family protein [Candidatus Binatia bacterium]